MLLGARSRSAGSLRLLHAGKSPYTAVSLCTFLMEQPLPCIWVTGWPGSYCCINTAGSR